MEIHSTPEENSTPPQSYRKKKIDSAIRVCLKNSVTEKGYIQHVLNALGWLATVIRTQSLPRRSSGQVLGAESSGGAARLEQVS